jgi:hypothetical protein
MGIRNKEFALSVSLRASTLKQSEPRLICPLTAKMLGALCLRLDRHHDGA